MVYLVSNIKFIVLENLFIYCFSLIGKGRIILIVVFEGLVCYYLVFWLSKVILFCLYVLFYVFYIV